VGANPILEFLPQEAFHQRLLRSRLLQFNLSLRNRLLPYYLAIEWAFGRGITCPQLVGSVLYCWSRLHPAKTVISGICGSVFPKRPTFEELQKVVDRLDRERSSVVIFLSWGRGGENLGLNPNTFGFPPTLGCSESLSDYDCIVKVVG